MFRLLLVDDEMEILDGLSTIIPWDHYDIELCGLAHNGIQALDMVERTLPHIVLTDIKMPNLSGLELIKKIGDIDATIKCVILSGYDDFSYAKQALLLRAVDYLLKPCMPGDILQAILKCVAQIKKEQSQTELVDDYIQKLDDSSGYVKQKLILDLLSAHTEHETLSCELIGMLPWMKDEKLIVALFYFEKSDNTPINTPYILNEIKKIISCYIPSEHFEIVWYIDNIVLVGRDIDIKTNDILEKIKYAASEQMNYLIYIGVSQTNTLDDLYASYKSAVQSLTKIYAKKKKSAYSPLIRTAIKYLEEHFTEELTLELISSQIYITPSYLSALFKQEVGMNFLDYLHHHRILKAKDLLKNVTLKSYEVAAKVGYKNEKHFFATFKKYTDMTPSQYRSSIV